MKYNNIWKKDWSEDRRQDALLFIKEAKLEKPMTKSASLRAKLIAGGTALGALGLGGNEYMKSRVDPHSGMTRREAARRAREAQDDTYRELTGRKRNVLVRKGEKAFESVGKKMDERKDIAVPALAATGGLLGGLSTAKALDYLKANARII